MIRRPVRKQRVQNRRDDLADEPRLVFIGLGTVALPFLFIRPFHGGQYGDKAIQRIAR